MKPRKFYVVVITVFCLLSSALSVAAVAPPPPPASGPGSDRYVHASLTAQRYGTGALEFWLFEPDYPKPFMAPVVVFNHGWGATAPGLYGAWIEHIVRRGNIVIFPRYQKNRKTPVRDFSPNAILAVNNALQELRRGSHVQPDLKRFASIGHSMGGMLTANLAASHHQLPRVKAAMAVEPGKSWGNERIAFPLRDLSLIPADTLLLTVAGDHDQLVKDIDAKRIFHEATGVPSSNKNFILFRSDLRGQPPLLASHHFPTAFSKTGLIPPPPPQDQVVGDGRPLLRRILKHRMEKKLEAQAQETGLSVEEIKQAVKASMGSVDALDYYGLWKLFDALCDAAFYGKNRDYALGNTPQQRFMGVWSDGTPVNEPVVTNQPDRAVIPGTRLRGSFR